MTAGDTTTNQGGGGAGASVTGFYLSTDSSLDATDVLLGSRPVVALTAGTADTGTVALTIPTSTGTGSFYLIAKADGGSAVPETAETNNSRARLIRMGPDLLIASMTVPATALPGQSITVANTTRNQGGGDAAASTTSFYLSTNTTLDASDVLVAGRSVDPLVAGGISTESTTVVLPADTVPGPYYLFAKADAGNTVPETQETNNTNFKVIQIGS
jgi:subtilase family serine protease